MSHQNTLDTLLSDLSQVERSDGYFFTSVTWSYAISLCYQNLRLWNLGGSEDADSVLRLEQNITRQEDLLTWARLQADTELVPEASRIVQIISKPAEVKAADAESLAETQEISVAEAHALLAEIAEERAIEVQGASERLCHMLDAALLAEPSTHLEHSDWDCLNLAQRLANKCEAYNKSKLKASVKTRNRQVQVQIGAERKLLNTIGIKAAELAARIESELEAVQEAIGEMH